MPDPRKTLPGCRFDARQLSSGLSGRRVVGTSTGGFAWHLHDSYQNARLSMCDRSDASTTNNSPSTLVGLPTDPAEIAPLECSMALAKTWSTRLTLGTRTYRTSQFKPFAILASVLREIEPSASDCSSFRTPCWEIPMRRPKVSEFMPRAKRTVFTHPLLGAPFPCSFASSRSWLSSSTKRERSNRLVKGGCLEVHDNALVAQISLQDNLELSICAGQPRTGGCASQVRLSSHAQSPMGPTSPSNISRACCS
jgi:hypothetical protein